MSSTRADPTLGMYGGGGGSCRSESQLARLCETKGVIQTPAFLTNCVHHHTVQRSINTKLSRTGEHRFREIDADEIAVAQHV